MQITDYPALSAMATRGDRLPFKMVSVPVFPEHLLREGCLLLKLGIGKPTIARMMLRAQENGTSVEAELLVSGEIDEALYFEALADIIGLPFLHDLDAERVHDLDGLDTQLASPETLRLYAPDRPPVTIIAPSLARLDDIAAFLARHPKLAGIMAVSTPSAVRAAAWVAGRQRRVNHAISRLFETVPLHSARIVFWGRQGFYAGAGLSLFGCALLLEPLVVILVLHILLGGVYFGQFFLRARALVSVRRHPGNAVSVGPASTPLPVYSIFVALYRETEVAAQLVAALDRLDWPCSRLDIKLICEADDHATIAALRALPLGRHYEIVEVPAAAPRTKPKALAYALAGVRGTYLVVYDAEDRPDPGQLREAHSAFTSAPASVACLQAPLIVTNAQESWLSAMFALEYSGLFRCLLPYLARAGLPLPLGGTSNHFRVAALKSVGGWDPYNTTEDADLGLRLHRLGYRSAMIDRPTLEDAPTEPGVWFAQRTRWYKGWLQTWLVLMRDPALLRRQLGWTAFATFQILIAGMVLSALGHPLFLMVPAFVAWMLLSGDMPDGWSVFAHGLLVIDSLNIIASYAIAVRLGSRPMTTGERRALGRKWMAIPIYWLMISGAAWSAVIELNRRPFAWHKTPHRATENTR
jgi:cellulose synthase/poly-beta-1,6-N-acetylglucosamine synthase-like glycosyltransferase